MERGLVNGGFPSPPDTQPARLVTSRHDACRGETRVRLPRHVPAVAVRRVVCAGCAQPYLASDLTDEGIEVPGQLEAPSQSVPKPRKASPSLPKLRLPEVNLPKPGWRLAALPVAAVAFVVALSAIQTGGEPATAPAVEPVPAADTTPTRAERASGARKETTLVDEATFQLALPGGWQRIAGPGGAAFAAVSDGGFADATLWVSRDEKLNFAAFEARAMDQVTSLAGSATVVERNAGPTPETTSLRIAAGNAPKGAPRYEVLLRSSGNYWYYLATTVQPEASGATANAVELLQGSLVPRGAKR